MVTKHSHNNSKLTLSLSISAVLAAIAATLSGHLLGCETLLRELLSALFLLFPPLLVEEDSDRRLGEGDFLRILAKEGLERGRRGFFRDLETCNRKRSDKDKECVYSSVDQPWTGLRV